VDLERQKLVAGYWQHALLARGDREQKLAAGDLFRAVETVNDVVMDGDVRDAVSLLDDLLLAPDADPSLVGAGPLEDLLTERGSEAGPVVALRCQESERWRDALGSVSVDPYRPGLAALAEWLPPG
jgi:hypothetical protein